MEPSTDPIRSDRAIGKLTNATKQLTEREKYRINGREDALRVPGFRGLLAAKVLKHKISETEYNPLQDSTPTGLAGIRY
jgi:hypothetical protein